MRVWGLGEVIPRSPLLAAHFRAFPACPGLHQIPQRHLLPHPPLQGYYFTGDGCRRDEDGYYWITGALPPHLSLVH